MSTNSYTYRVDRVQYLSLRYSSISFSQYVSMKSLSTMFDIATDADELHRHKIRHIKRLLSSHRIASFVDLHAYSTPFIDVRRRLIHRNLSMCACRMKLFVEQLCFLSHELFSACVRLYKSYHYLTLTCSCHFFPCRYR
jgi:hypothetical protein